MLKHMITLWMANVYIVLDKYYKNQQSLKILTNIEIVQ